MSEQSKTIEAIEKSLKGYGANAIAIVLTQPLEVLRVQSQITPLDGSNGVTRLAKSIYQKQSFSGFYKGLGASLVTQPVYWSIFFPTYFYLEKHTK